MGVRFKALAVGRAADGVPDGFEPSDHPAGSQRSGSPQPSGAVEPVPPEARR